MLPFKALWKSWTSDAQKPPERNEHTMIAESLMMELEFHIREVEQAKWEIEQEEKKKQTGVDYSWLISTQPKQIDIPQLERLELEELCYQVRPCECSKITTLFRDAMVRIPTIQEMPRIMKACVLQTIEQRPKEESFSEWMIRRTSSLSNLKLRPSPKITPICPSQDIEANPHYHRNHTVPDFRGRINTLPV